MPRLPAWLWSLVPLATGCLAEPALEDGTADLSTSNGTMLNGTALNGAWLNGPLSNGIKRNTDQFDGLTVDGGVLVAQLPNGTSSPLAVGDVIDATTGAGTRVTIAVTGVRARSFGTVRDPSYGWVTHDNAVTYYRLRVTVWGQTFDYCANGAEAVPVRGRWNEYDGSKVSDPNAITLACGGYALGKCIDAGYFPWGRWLTSSDFDTTAGYWFDLDAYHQACVRAIRADYDGNGVPHTTDGRTTDIADPLHVQEPEHDGAWLPEADWGPDGALCVARPRMSEQDYYPSPIDHTSYCGNRPDALVRTRIPTGF